MNTIELPPKMDDFLRRLGNAVLELASDEKGWVMRPRLAFAVCLALSDDDPRQAAELVKDLQDAIDEYNAASAGAGSPFPAP